MARRAMSEKLLQLILTACIYATSYSATDIFEIVPKGVDASEGRQTILQCSLKEEFKSVYTLIWLLDGTEIVNGERYKISDGKLSFTKVDKNLDSGKFQCLAKNPNNPRDSHISDPVSLNIKWCEVGPITLVQPAKKIDIVPGVSVTLKCNFTGNPKPRTKDLKWFLNGRNLHNDSKFNAEKERLHIPDVRLYSYDGAYSCCVPFNMEQKCSVPDYKIRVRDEAVPLLVKPPKDVIVPLDGDAKFSCEVKSTPAAQIEWYYNQKLLSNKSRPNEECRVCVYPNGALVIKKVKKRYEGFYKCKAIGVKGNATEAKAKLSLAYLNPFSENSAECDLELGANIEKACNVPEGLPPPEISWIKDGVKIEPVIDSSSSPRVTVLGNTLVITSAQPIDEGDYMCVAKNIANEVTKTFRCTIATSPVILSDLVSRIETEGNDVTLKCDVSGSPPIFYSWYKEQNLVIPDEHFITISNQLIIRKISVEDASKYTCVASNNKGNASSSAKIKVKEELKFDPRLKDTCIEEGRKTEIICAARSTKQPRVEWSSEKEDGNEYYVVTNNNNEANKSLIFNNPKAGYQELFICTATASDDDDMASRKTQTITVTVGKKPVATVKVENPTVFQGTDVLLDCGIKHIKYFSQVKWIVHANNTSMTYTLSTNAHHTHHTVMNNGSLFLKTAIITDTGYYTCHYQGCGMKVYRNITLVVAESDKPIATQTGQVDLFDGDGTPEYKKIQTVALAVGGSVAYLILTITIIVYCRRKKRHKQSKNSLCSVVERENLNLEEEKLLNRISGNGDCNEKGENIPLAPISLPEELKDLLYDSSKLEKVTVIGRGCFGEVFLSKAPGFFPDLHEDILVMVKQFDQVDKHHSRGDSKESLPLSTFESSSLKEFNREITLLHRSKHDNVVRLLGICSELMSPNSPDHLITEYLEWGILKLCLQASKEGKLKKFSKNLKMHMCSQIAAGLEHLTTLKLPHGDVATRNCVVSSKMLIKLTVLSLNKDGFHNEYCTHKGKLIPIRWMPPETLLDDTYNLKSDVWSFGVTCWEIFSLGTMPFSDLSNEDFIKGVQSECPPTLPSLSNSKRITSLISKCCKVSPSARPEFHQIVKKLLSILTMDKDIALQVPT